MGNSTTWSTNVNQCVVPGMIQWGHFLSNLRILNFETLSIVRNAPKVQKRGQWGQKNTLGPVLYYENQEHKIKSTIWWMWLAQMPSTRPDETGLFIPRKNKRTSLSGRWRCTVPEYSKLTVIENDIFVLVCSLPAGSSLSPQIASATNAVCNSYSDVTCLVL